MRRRMLAACAIALLALACGGPTSPTPTGIAGTWSLLRINGQALPYVFRDGSDSVEVQSDILTIGAGGTYTQATRLRLSIGGSVATETVPDTGTYTLNGTAVTFTASDGSTIFGSVEGRTLTLTQEGFAFVYQKQ